MTVPVDQPVRDRIRDRLDESLCVEAGAGTGKTTAVVARVVATLAAGRATVDELAVITFTEAAAAELAARVREGLEEALAAEADGERRARVERALADLHRARIETIHAFAANLLRERPVEAGIDPGFEVLDELAGRLRFDEAYARWLDELLQGGQPELLRCLNRGFDLKQLRALVEAVDSHRALLPLEPWTAPAPDLAAFRRRLREIAADLADLAQYTGRCDRAAGQIKRIVEFARRVEKADDDWLERLVLFDAPRIEQWAGSKDQWDDQQACNRARGLWWELRKEQLEPLAAALRTQALVGVLPLAEAFVRAYTAERRADGVADYDDLLVWARDLLLASPEARSYFRRRFKVVLVDEFQDTDPLQAEIALLIASDSEDGPGWPELVPEPGRLVVVGDPKQSIYRFRRADIAVYDAIKSGPLAGGVEQLSQNFRSRPGVLEFANRLFDRLLVAEEGVQPANVPLAPVETCALEPEYSVVVLHGSAEKSAAAQREEEVRLVAAAIRRLVDAGWEVRDPSTGEPRPVRYGDVVCLFRARTVLTELEEALEAQRIPYRVEGSRSFFKRQEVRDLGHVLRAIDDPTDRLSIFAALCSGAFSCSYEEVYLFTAAGNRLGYLHQAETGPEPVRTALETLLDLHRLQSRVSLAELVRETIARTRLVESALAAPDGAQGAANLLKLAESARAFSSAGGGGLRDFARWIAENEEREADETEAGIADEADEVVRLMTIHAAKGLEFPVVVLAGLTGQTQNLRRPVPERDARRLHLRVGAGSGRWKAEFATPGFDAAWTHEERQEEAERRRLLYVAVTRARDRLVIPAVVPSEGQPGVMLAELLPSLPAFAPERAETVVDGCFLADPALLPPAFEAEEAEPERVAPEEVEAAVAARDRWDANRAALLARARSELAIEPATARDGAEPIRALAGLDDAPLIVGEGPPREIGEALHAVLERADLADPESLPPIVEAVCDVAGLADHVDEVLALARACLDSPAVQRALAAPRRWREVPYTLPMEGGFRTGRIDLVFEDDGGLAVVDFKSDAVGPDGAAAAAESHRGQVEAYCEALAATTGRAVTSAILVFPRAGVSVDLLRTDL